MPAPIVDAAPAPVIPVPVEQPVTDIEDQEVPLGVQPEENEDSGSQEEQDEQGQQDDQEEQDSQETVTIDDGDVPLADMNNISDTKHCPVHGSGLLLAAIMGGIFAGSTRKQKKEVNRLKEGLGDKER